MTDLLTIELLTSEYGEIVWLGHHPTVPRRPQRRASTRTRECLRCGTDESFDTLSCPPFSGTENGLLVHLHDPEEHQGQELDDISRAGAYHRSRGRIIVLGPTSDERGAHTFYAPCLLCNTEALPLLLAGWDVPVTEREGKLPQLPQRCVPHGLRWCPDCSPTWPRVEDWPSRFGDSSTRRA